MRPTLTVFTGPQGRPCAHVPSACLWELIQSVASQRVAVSCQYAATHFTVTFHQLTTAHAQAVLDQWSRSNGNQMEAEPEAYHIPEWRKLDYSQVWTR